MEEQRRGRRSELEILHTRHRCAIEECERELWRARAAANRVAAGGAALADSGGLAHGADRDAAQVELARREARHQGRAEQLVWLHRAAMRESAEELEELREANRLCAERCDAVRDQSCKAMEAQWAMHGARLSQLEASHRVWLQEFRRKSAADPQAQDTP